MPYACLVIDVQEHFRGMAEEIVAPLNTLTRACREAGVPVVFTQHGRPGWPTAPPAGLGLRGGFSWWHSQATPTQR